MNQIDELLEKIKEWAEYRSDFDMTFVDSLEEQYLAKGELSERQVQALENICDKWGIE
jgi:hypothetical protein